MEKFNDYFTEKFEEPLEQNELHIVVLGKGGEEGTFADLAETVAKKKNIKYDLVNVDEAWISQKDVEIGSVTIQNVDGKAQTDPDVIKKNLIQQLTAPVLWTQIMNNMIADGVTTFVEVGGTGKVLTGLVKKVDRKFPCEAI